MRIFFFFILDCYLFNTVNISKVQKKNSNLKYATLKYSLIYIEKSINYYYFYLIIYIIYYLLTESEVITGKSQTESLMY